MSFVNLQYLYKLTRRHKTLAVVIVIACRIDQLGPMCLTHYLLMLNQAKRRLFALGTLCTEFLFVRDLLHSCLALRDSWQGE